MQRLSRGVFSRPNEILALHPCLLILQRSYTGLHVGGASALDWYGVRHYVTQRPVLHLYGWDAGKLPEWFVQRFPSDYHRKRLFDEPPGAPLHVTPFESQAEGPAVSVPERALLELLSEVGVRQTLQGSRELVEGLTSLRAATLNELLKRCKSVKTVRLCLQLGEEYRLPWVQKLDRRRLPTGSDKAWVSRTEEGTLRLPP